MGLIPGDPTAESLPEDLPPAPASLTAEQSDVTVVDLADMSYEALMELSRASAADPLGQLLPEPPGILPEREAHLTGAETGMLSPHCMMHLEEQLRHRYAIEEQFASCKW